MNRGLRPHLIWGLLGICLAAGMWFAWSIPGAIVMFAAIGMAFVLWYRMGSRGSWVALITVGLCMSSVLGWQAATGSRCPEGDREVFMRTDRPPIDCTDVRSSAASMAVFFGIIALIGIAAPLYSRREPEPGGDIEPELDSTPTP